jgi:hypothetical protein
LRFFVKRSDEVGHAFACIGGKRDDGIANTSRT